jgi:hypothetical protein
MRLINQFRMNLMLAAVATGTLLFGELSPAQVQSNARLTAKHRAAKPPAARAHAAPFGRHPRAKLFAIAVLMDHPPKVDANGDGTITDIERAAARLAVKSQLLERFDSNGDGKIGPAERHAVRQAVRDKALEMFDMNRNGRIDRDERPAIRKFVHEKMLYMIDANGNGVIDENERPRPGDRAAEKARRPA